MEEQRAKVGGPTSCSGFMAELGFEPRPPGSEFVHSAQGYGARKELPDCQSGELLRPLGIVSPVVKMVREGLQLSQLVNQMTSVTWRRGGEPAAHGQWQDKVSGRTSQNEGRRQVMCGATPPRAPGTDHTC